MKDSTECFDKLFGVAFGEYRALIADEVKRATYYHDQMRLDSAGTMAITWVAKMYGPTIAHMVTMADDKGKF
jgi:hypothetical protein